MSVQTKHLSDGLNRVLQTFKYKRQSKNVQKWEFKNVQFYSLNISFKR